MKVLAIFTCYNRKEKTIACIESLRQNDVGIEYIVVDDGSTDGTAEALSDYPNVEVLKGNGNLFYSGGMRMGISAAMSRDLSSFDYIVFMNDDVVFFGHALDRMIALENGEGVIVAGATCDESGTLSYGGVIQMSRFRPKYRTIMSGEGNKVYCDTTCANCVLIPRGIFEKLPNIDSHYCHSMGDFDYGHEAVRQGYRILAGDFFVGVCNDNPSEGTWRDSAIGRKNRLRKKESPKGLPFKEYYHYLRKNFNFSTAVIYSLIPYIRILIGK